VAQLGLRDHAEIAVFAADARGEGNDGNGGEAGDCEHAEGASQTCQQSTQKISQPSEANDFLETSEVHPIQAQGASASCGYPYCFHLFFGGHPRKKCSSYPSSSGLQAPSEKKKKKKKQKKKITPQKKKNSADRSRSAMFRSKDMILYDASRLLRIARYLPSPFCVAPLLSLFRPLFCIGRNTLRACYSQVAKYIRQFDQPLTNSLQPSKRDKNRTCIEAKTPCLICSSRTATHIRAWFERPSVIRE